MTSAILFGGTTFYNQKLLFQKPENVSNQFDELLFSPQAGIQSAGNDDIYAYFNTGSGKTAGDTLIHDLLKTNSIPALYTEKGMDIYAPGGIDKYVDTNRTTLETIA